MSLKKLLLLLPLLVWFFVSVSYLTQATIISQSLPIQDAISAINIPGALRGVSTHFQITNSKYLNISVDSSRIINAKIESIPKMITMIVESGSYAISSNLTIHNLTPLTTYYKYEDNHHNLTIFTSDINGSYSYNQDIASRHLIFIKVRPSTKYISDNQTGGDCASIGSWNADTKTCTLTTNVNETIQIDSNGVTLDGAGYSINGPGNTGGYGIFVSRRNNVSIKNLNVSGFSYGVYLYNSSGNNLINNNSSNNQVGISMPYGSNNVFNRNIISSNFFQGIAVYSSTRMLWRGNQIFGTTHRFSFYMEGSTDSHFDNDIDTSNTVSGKPIYYIKNASGVTYDSSTNAGEFYCIACNNVTVKDLNLGRDTYGVFFWKTNNSRIENVSRSDGGEGIALLYSDGNTIIGNNFLNSQDGIILGNSDDNTITGNTISNTAYGLLVSSSNSNTISQNTVSNSIGDGMFLQNADNNIIYKNNFINNSTQIYVNPYVQSTGNVFNLSLPIGGNYWSNFDAPSEGCGDSNTNKICDGVYTFNGGQDNYPWTIKNVWSPSIPSFSGINQYKFDGVTAITEGITITQARTIFKATMTDADNYQVKLEVEAKLISVQFNGQNTLVSSLVDSGQTAIVTAIDLFDGDYHWRARAVDSNGVTSDWQEFGTTENVDFKVKVRNPVVIIPGVAGTRLSFTNSYGTQTEVWPNVLSIMTNESDSILNYLKLSSTGEEDPSVPIKVGDIIRKIDILGYTPNDTFGSLIDELIDNGYREGQDLFVFPYDWRFDLKNNVGKLSEKINTAIGNGYSKVDIVAHSMGGLLSKKYIYDYAYNKVDKLIFVGTPQTGSPWAYKTLIYGNDMDMKVLGQSILDPGTIKDITQNMPSIYELLPTKKYVDTNGHKYVTDTFNTYISSPGSQPPDLDYIGTKSFMVSKGSNANMFSLAERLHDAIDNMNLAGIKTYNFVGCGSPTLAKITDRKKIVYVDGIPFTIDDPLIAYTNGDKTVPRVSAEDQPTTAKYFVNDVPHGDLPSAESVRGAISEILLSQNLIGYYSSDISTDPSVCTLIEGDVISYHSPIALHVYDSQGRHTGPTTSGHIEYGVPGVAYDVLGEAKFAYLPKGDTYTVKGNATDTGSFDLLVQKVDDTTVLETTSFNDVPLNILQTNSSISITPGNQTSFNLKVDQDGNDVFETSLTPTSILDQTQSADVTSPLTSISLSGTEGENNWYTSNVVVTLTATDDNSGVLKTEYSIDNGATYAKYISPFTITIEGVNSIKYFSVDKIGNMETIHIQTIKIDKTPPEAKISFDQTSGLPKIEGTDNLSTPTVVRSDSSNYVVKDDAGHTLKIKLTAIVTAPTLKNPAVLDMLVNSLQYDSNPVIKLPATNLHYQWLGTPLTFLNESVIVLTKFSITGVYDPVQNNTVLTIKENGLTTTKVLHGVNIVKLKTTAGILGFEW